MHPVQDKASQFSTLSTQDEWRGKSDNKNVKKIIAKTTKTYKDWHEKLPFVLHAYRRGSDIDWGNSIFIGLRNEGCFAY